MSEEIKNEEIQEETSIGNNDDSEENETQEEVIDGNEIEENQNDFNGAPETYDFKEIEMPDGVEFSQELADKFSPIAKKLNLSQKGANEIVGIYLDILKEQHASAPEILEKYQADLQNAKTAQYEKMLNQDEEIGGGDEDKMNKYIDVANVGYKKFANESLQNLFKETGLRYHPEVVKLFHKLGKMSGDDKIDSFGSPVSNETPAQILYGNKE